MAVRRIWCQHGISALANPHGAVCRARRWKVDPLDLDEDEGDVTEEPPKAQPQADVNEEGTKKAEKEKERERRPRKVYTFGSRLNGRTGVNVTSTEIHTMPLKKQPPMHIEFFDNFEIKKVAGYYKHYMVLLEDGRVFGWGSNAYGQLGCGDSTQDKHAPVLVRTEDGEPLKNIVDISVGKYHSAAVDSEGRVFTWGYGGRKVRMVRPGHLLGRAPSHGIFHQYSPYAQAIDQFGPMNDMEVESEDNPFEAGKSMNPKAVQVSCGSVHTVVLDSVGRAWTWGYGEWGRLAQEDNENRDVPTPVTHFLDERTGLPRLEMATVKACESVTAFATRDGSAYTSGRNTTRQLGHGGEAGVRTARFEATNMPVGVDQLSHVASMSFGSHGAMALTRSGVPYVWGCKDPAGPKALSGFGQRSKQKVIKVSCGTGMMNDHRAFVTSCGMLYINGSNLMGQSLQGDAGANPLAKLWQFVSSLRKARISSIAFDSQAPAYFKDKFVVDVTCGHMSTVVLAEDMTEEEVGERNEMHDEIIKEWKEAEAKKTKSGKARTKFSNA